MLPVVTEEIRESLMQVLGGDLKAWKKQMIHHLKEDNPEINALLLDLAQDSEDPKNVILAGYLVYKVLEMAQDEENRSMAIPGAMGQGDD